MNTAKDVVSVVTMISFTAWFCWGTWWISKEVRRAADRFVELRADEVAQLIALKLETKDAECEALKEQARYWKTATRQFRIMRPFAEGDDDDTEVEADDNDLLGTRGKA